MTSPLDAAARDAAPAPLDTTQGRWGRCLLKGFPVHPLDRGRDPPRLLGHGPAHGRRLHAEPRQRLHERCARRGRRPQSKNGRGYNTNAGLDFHTDSCDVVGLLCRRAPAPAGPARWSVRSRCGTPCCAAGRNSKPCSIPRSTTATRARRPSPAAALCLHDPRQPSARRSPCAPIARTWWRALARLRRCARA